MKTLYCSHTLGEWESSGKICIFLLTRLQLLTTGLLSLSWWLDNSQVPCCWFILISAFLNWFIGTIGMHQTQKTLPPPISPGCFLQSPTIIFFKVTFHPCCICLWHSSSFTWMILLLNVRDTTEWPEMLYSYTGSERDQRKLKLGWLGSFLKWEKKVRMVIKSFEWRQELPDKIKMFNIESLSLSENSVLNNSRPYKEKLEVSKIAQCTKEFIGP